MKPGPRANLAVDCTAGVDLMPVDAAFAAITALASPLADLETLPVRASLGRILAEPVSTHTALPRFDHSAVDGYGLAAADLERQPPFNLRVAAEVAAGDVPRRALEAGSALRLFTGAPVPEDVGGVVLEERCRRSGSSVTVNVRVSSGANIRRRGEDVAEGAMIVSAGEVLDARHVAMLTAAGVPSVGVTRRVRVAVLSNGNELVDALGEPSDGQIHDANRPMLLALLSRPSIDGLDFGCHRDDPAILSRTFERAAAEADVVISSGGVAGSDADHIAKAVRLAGGSMRRFRLALKPGKLILAGRIGTTPVLGLPGNPVATLVNFLLFGRPLVSIVAGSVGVRPEGQAAVSAEPFSHAEGRTDFVPVRITGRLDDGRPLLSKLGRGGSARLRPLVLADGLAELDAAAADLPATAPVRFHPFAAAFAP